MIFKPGLFSKNHLKDRELARYVDALVQDKISELPGWILRHVENCPRCKDRILDLVLTLNETGISDKPAPRIDRITPEAQKKMPPTRQVVYRIAASFFVLAFLATVYVSLFHPAVFKESVGSQDRSASAAQTSGLDQNSAPGSREVQKAIGKNHGRKNNQTPQHPDFKINPNLELMINSRFRDEAISVLSPLNLSVHKGKITFAWEPFSGDPVQLKILNNKSQILFRYTLKKNRFTLGEKLTPGLYYWKLESSSDLLYVGKFFIRNGITRREE